MLSTRLFLSLEKQKQKGGGGNVEMKCPCIANQWSRFFSDEGSLPSSVLKDNSLLL